MSDLNDGTPEWHRRHPIYLKPEDMLDSKEALLEKIRGDLRDIRGQLDDIRFGYGWDDRLATAQEGITLVISYLYHLIEEMKKASVPEE